MEKNPPPKPSHITINRQHALVASLILGGLALLLIGIFLGQIIGRRQALHARQWQQNYTDNFFPDQAHGTTGLRVPPPGPFQGYAVTGEILNLHDQSFALHDFRQNVEQSVLVDTKTIIRQDTQAASFSDLSVGKNVAVFGHPNSNGQISARLVRILNQ